MSRKTKTKKVQKTSPDLIREHTDQLKALFPECVTEGRVDFEKLKATLGDEVDSRPERYSFSWAGKRDAVRILQTPTPATLIPDEKESVDFDKTKNIFIEGDNLEVLKLLYKSYFGRVKMIYIDPPYNTGNDFIYPDNYTDPLDTYLKITGQKDSEGNHLTSNAETNGRYHSAWLSMMYPRLFLARQLLRDDGVIFVSIDDNELHNLIQIMNEIFGEENHIATFVWVKKKKGSHLSKTHRSMTEYVVCFSRTQCLVDMFGENAYSDKWQPLAKRTNAKKELIIQPHIVETTLESGSYPPGTYGKGTSSIELLEPMRVVSGKIDSLIRVKGPFVWTQGKLDDELKNGTKISLSKKFGFNVFRYNQSDKFKRPTTLLNNEAGIGTNEDASKELLELFSAENLIDYPKPSTLISYFIRSVSYFEKDSIILDFFAGSATTAHAALALNREDHGNRRYIMVQLPEPTGRDDFKTISDIGKERIRRVIKKLKSEKQGKLDLKERSAPEDMGFRVFKLAPSNYKHWKGVEAHDAEALAKQMEAFTDPLVEKWKADNVIWEVAIKEGYSLSSNIEKVAGIKHNTIYRVSDQEREQHFRICLDDAIKTETVKALGLKKDELFVCRDVALDDELAANLALQCRLKTI